MDEDQEIKRLRCLLVEALSWLDDYGMRMSGTADLVNRIRKELDDEE